MMLTGGKQPRNVIFAALGCGKVYASRSCRAKRVDPGGAFGVGAFTAMRTLTRRQKGCALTAPFAKIQWSGLASALTLPFDFLGAAPASMLMAFVVVPALVTVKAQVA